MELRKFHENKKHLRILKVWNSMVNLIKMIIRKCLIEFLRLKDLALISLELFSILLILNTLNC